MEFLWDFGDGGTSTAKEPVYKFKTSGLHEVSLIVFNPPSGCSDTLIKTVESFSPPLVGVDGFPTYCPGEKTNLKAYGAYEYKWSTGEKTDSIIIGSPGGDYWMEGFSSTGCKAKVELKINEEPYWPFTVTDVSFLCKGETLELEAQGAVSYIWDTGEITSSILVSTKGTYKVTGTNQRGCKKQESVILTEDDLPKADFKLSAYVVNDRHNTITGSIKQENFVNYQWDMGDGSQGSGNTYIHSYDLKPDDLEFNVSLISTNENGCINSSTRKVNVELFIPNVFTPNQDGSNDTFMPDYFVQIFDRNGILLFSGTEGWDGNYKGKQLDPDTYFYVLEYVNIRNEKYKKQGYITLVR
jgi:gliding motility-associated-like protein